MRLHDKVALITGAGSGIGRATALAFAGEGATVVIVDLDRQKGDQVAEEIARQGGNALALEADVTKEASVGQVAEELQTQLGRVDILDNNAGVFLMKPLSATTTDDFHQVMDLNVKAALMMCKHLVPLMIAAGGGSIINIASLSGLRARPNVPLYAASKGAIVALTRSLAVDFGKDGVRANAICPAATATPMLERHYESIPDGAARRRADEAAVPLGRHARPEDIAEVAVFLASDQSAYLNGQVIAVDGGSMAGTMLV
ncbi:MAG: SDR family NAD(P)-dependent oxidoreductase [Lentisphaeria bacterium]|jgi:NAD(P)-dependent dehydrogenase (short-subunit alcohol dehydrogenase family)|nr:SDR family NAD(P)-dependent oxidoreductase [Lentisphaeria bacterium]MDP7740717.1 SDR family NAD(P)-dependent oxidoreductase [Lentisphaeria bacterium]